MVTVPDKIVLDKENALYAWEDCVDTETGSWRHGHTETFVFLHDNGAYYRATIRFHPEDGAQLYDPIEAHRVVPVEYVEIVWERPK